MVFLRGFQVAKNNKGESCLLGGSEGQEEEQGEHGAFMISRMMCEINS
jgi:hypothetical protein